MKRSPSNPVSLQGHFSVAEDGTVRLAGELMTTARAACAMCLSTRERSAMKVPLRRNCTARTPTRLEDEAFHYEGSRVTLDQLALTLLMLNLPMRFLCARSGAVSGRDAENQYVQTGDFQELVRRGIADTASF